MPDITMCAGLDCEKKNNCYRFTAKPSEHQSWMSPTPDEQAGWCDYFIEAKSKSQVRRLDTQTKKPKPSSP